MNLVEAGNRYWLLRKVLHCKNQHLRYKTDLESALKHLVGDSQMNCEHKETEEILDFDGEANCVLYWLYM